jgi:hypothetical protein
MIRKLPKEHRKKKRAPISVPVKYTDLSEVSDVKKKVTGKGMSADLSDNGLGIFSDKELKPETVVEIECEDIWETSKQFTVKWCSRIKHNFYRLGLAVRK